MQTDSDKFSQALINFPPHATFFTMLELLLQLQNAYEKFPASPADLEKNQTFLDEVFLHGKYAKFQDANFNLLQGMNEAEFIHWKAYLEEITNNKKIEFFTELLTNEKISLSYFKIQFRRYQLKTLKKCCFFTLSKNIAFLQHIDQLPLPKPLQKSLREFAEQQINDTHLELRST